jgi:hypothetical protein
VAPAQSMPALHCETPQLTTQGMLEGQVTFANNPSM